MVNKLRISFFVTLTCCLLQPPSPIITTSRIGNRPPSLKLLNVRILRLCPSYEHVRSGVRIPEMYIPWTTLSLSFDESVCFYFTTSANPYRHVWFPLPDSYSHHEHFELYTLLHNHTHYPSVCGRLFPRFIILDSWIVPFPELLLVSSIPILDSAMPVHERTGKMHRYLVSRFQFSDFDSVCESVRHDHPWALWILSCTSYYVSILPFIDL